jgi:hypothetical protein
MTHGSKFPSYRERDNENIDIAASLAPLGKGRANDVLDKVGQTVEVVVSDRAHRPHDRGRSQGPQTSDDANILDWVEIKFKRGKSSKVSEGKQVPYSEANRLYIFSASGYRRFQCG